MTHRDRIHLGRTIVSLSEEGKVPLHLPLSDLSERARAYRAISLALDSNRKSKAIPELAERLGQLAKDIELASGPNNKVVEYGPLLDHLKRAAKANTISSPLSPDELENRWMQVMDKVSSTQGLTLPRAELIKSLVADGMSSRGAPRRLEELEDIGAIDSWELGKTMMVRIGRHFMKPK
jgi:hypothetical protein